MWTIEVPENFKSTPTTNVTSSGYIGKVVNCTKLNMRSTPNVESNNVVCILLVNDTVEIIGRAANGWYQVKTKDNLVGYVSNKYITIL